ncbi:MAG: hypothetical protein KDK24_09985 [Pseudooceanicola sp.]|nr:hypothetical protein [Pseudooceanicola sp.]
MHTFAILAPFIRIALRYAAGALMARGWFTEADAALFLDDEFVGAMVAVFNEAWYALAVKRGWAK